MKARASTIAAALLAPLLSFFSASDSRADLMLYGVTFFDNQLISIDANTGAATLVGPLGTPMSPFGLATYNNGLYTFDSTADVIRQIDPTTGATASTINVGMGAVLGQGGLAISKDGIGFLSSALDPKTLDPANNLYELNLKTGTSFLLGHTSSTLEALAFSPDGTLYGLGKFDGDLYKLNTSTAAMTLVGNTGADNGSLTGGLTFHPDGTLYATFNDALFTLNTTNGLATAVNSDPNASTGFSSISGLAVAAVPEPSPLLLFAAATGVLGVFKTVQTRLKGHTATQTVSDKA